MTENKKTTAGTPNGRTARRSTGKRQGRRFLTGCLVTLLVVLVVLLAAWWIASRHVGSIISSTVRERAGESINGRLEFDSLDVDLAGRAVMLNAAIYPVDSDTAVVTCPKVVIGFDLFNLLGPNRGRSEINIQLIDPELTVVRRPDGSFNLADLAKPREEDSEPLNIGVSVLLRNARIDFSDGCMLDQTPFTPPDASGIAREVLAELGCYRENGTEYLLHSEEIGVDGSVTLNLDREELAFNLKLDRGDQGGLISSRGSSSTDGARFDADLKIDGLDLISLNDYLRSAFPALTFAPAGESRPEQPTGPCITALVDNTTVNLTQHPGKPLAVSTNLQVNGLWYSSETLPELTLPRFKLAYNSEKGTVNPDFELAMLGSTISGKPVYNAKDGRISGQLTVSCPEIPRLATALGLKDLPVTGALNAKITLTGTSDAPDIHARLSSDALGYEDLRLGQLTGAVAYKGSEVTLDEVKLAKGEAPLSVTGSYDTASGSGSLAVTAGPLESSKAISLASRATGSKAPSDLKISGPVKATLNLSLGSRTSSSFVIESDKLTYQGFTLGSVSIKAGFDAPNINIESAKAVVTTAEPVAISEFKSNGRLKLSVQLGGSVSQLPGEQPVLALAGSGRTTNLAPEQADVNFKLIGPANDPEIRLQVKTTGADTPLVFHATGHYRQGYSPVKASLDWHDTSATYEGKVDLQKQLLDGTIKARDVDLARFFPEQRISGSVTADAKLGGSFDKPTVSGQVTSPGITLETDRRPYSATDIDLNFDLVEGNTVKVEKGSFQFEGNQFKASGTMQQDGGDLTITCNDFNLFSAIALVPVNGAAAPGVKTAPSRPPIEVRSSGPLTIRLTGSVEQPLAAVTYQSGAGQVEGHAFTSAKLTASATRDGATVKSFTVASPDGSITASGGVVFEPLSYNGDATIEQFDVAVIAPLTGIEQLTELTGKLNGQVSFSGTKQRIGADGKLRLDGGSYQGVALTEVSADLSTKGESVEIRNGRVIAKGTTLNVSGTVGKDPADTQIKAEAQSMDLALLEPFLPETAPRMAGILKLNMDLKPGTGTYPNLDLTVQDTGQGLSIEGRHIDSLSGKIAIKNDALTITKCDVAVNGSSLNLTGSLDLHAVNNQTGESLPLNLSLDTKDFNIADAAPLIPNESRDYVPEGKVTCDLTFSGTSLNPRISGNVVFDITKLPALVDIPIAGISGQVNFAQNGFDIRRINITPAAGHDLNELKVTGSGTLSLNPIGLRDGQIQVLLAPEGKYTHLNIPGYFDGTLGGQLLISGSQKKGRISTEIRGTLVINQPGGNSIIKYNPPQEGQETTESPFRFGSAAKGLEIVVQEGTKFRYNPPSATPITKVDLQAELTGRFSLFGIPGRMQGEDALKICGELDIPKGSLYVYRHTIRLEKGANRLQFACAPGDLFPILTARGAVVLPRVLSGNEQLASDNPLGSTSISSNQDLTVIFNFDRVKLDPASGGLDQIRLTSEPPLPRETIMNYLTGGAGEVLTGHGDFSEFAEQEAVGIGTGLISHQIEQALGLEQFSFGGTGSDNNPFYVSMEKEITPEASLTYFRDFYSTTNQKEEFGLKYQLLDARSGNKYENVQLRLNFENNELGGTGGSFMFMYNIRF